MQFEYSPLIWLDDPRCSLTLVGGKAANLASLKRQGFWVPHGFVVMAPGDSNVVEIQDIKRLGGFPVAVRSNGQSEDGAQQSFAGQYQTFLNISNLEELETSIKECFSSVDSLQVASYCARTGIKDSGKMQVFIQKMVHPYIAGVAFTIHPTSGDDHTIYIECVEGLADQMIHGHRQPYQFCFDTSRWELMSAQGDPNLFWRAGTTLEHLVETLLDIQAYFGQPQDIEWAIDQSGNIWILQSRPITSFKSPATQDIFTDADFRDGGVSARVCTPMMYSLYQQAFEQTLPRYLDKIGLLTPLQSESIQDGPHGNPPTWIRMYLGRVYWNSSLIKRCLASLPGFNEMNFDRDLGLSLDYGQKGATVTPSNIGALIKALPVAIKLNIEFRRTLCLIDRWRKEFSIEESRILSLMRSQETLDLEALRSQLKDVFEFQTKTESHYFWVIYNNANAVGELRKALEGMGLGDKTCDLIQDLGGVPHVALYSDFEALVTLAEKHGIDNVKYQTARQKFFESYYHFGDAELDILAPRWSEIPDDFDERVKGLMHAKMRPPHTTLPIKPWELDPEISKKLTFIERLKLDYLLSQARDFLLAREQMRVLSSKSYALLRKTLLAFGDALYHEKIIGNPEDVFFLHINECLVLGSTSLEANDSSIVRQKEMLHRRKKIYAGQRFARPPHEFGMQVSVVEVDLSKTKSSLAGVGSSGGKLKGTARVLNSLEHCNRLLPGEILVTRFTDPGWTPLLARAGAVVTEVGGLLSHAAVISREFRIPAVLNVAKATQVIQDGQQIFVDGDTGQIFLEESLSS